MGVVMTMEFHMLLLLLLLGLTQAQYYDYTDEYAEEIDDYSDAYSSYSTKNDDYTLPAPTFITKAREVEVNEGGMIFLDCQYNSYEVVPIIWSKVDEKNTVIAVDEMMFGQYEGRGRVTVNKQRSELIINGKSTADAGVYKCTVAASENAPELLHTVKIRTPATIVSVNPTLEE